MNTINHPTTNQNWFFRYKIYHLPFWFVYHFLWWIMALGSPAKALDAILFFPYAVKYSIYVLFQALSVYLNLYYLIPRFLEKSRFSRYIVYLSGTMLVTALLLVSGYYVSAYLARKTVDELYGAGSPVDHFFSFLGNAFISTVASMTLAMSIKLTKHWIQTRQRQQLLEKEKLETELTFLKNQFNPHFLFNTINSIFFLIPKNPDMASASLAKFSELLRYQLYECNDQQISLSQEIAYLKNFIELEKLRQESNVRVTLEIDPGFTDQLAIAPFILMTFVENAFKHVSKSSDQPNWLTIKLGLDQQQLGCCIANSHAPHLATEAIHYGGIGLKNVQRRLDLLYPDRYELTIQNEANQFAVRLRLQLTPVVSAPVFELAY